MLITVREYAKYRGLSASYIYRLIKQGRLRQEADRKIDRERADAILDGRLEDAEDIDGLEIPRGATTSDLISAYNRARAQLTAAKAALAKLELEQAQGKYIDAEDVRQTAYTAGKRIKDAMLRIPDRISPQLAAMTDIVAIRNMLTDEIRQALTELKTDLQEGVNENSSGDTSKNKDTA